MAVKVREYKGKWWLFIDHKGKRKKKCVGSDKRAAVRAAKLVEAQLALGTLGLADGNARRPFDAYWRAWLDSYVRSHCKRSTYDGYEATGRRYLIPAFGTKDLREITRDDVKRLVPAVLGHRLLLSAEAEMRGRTPLEVLTEILDAIPVPGATGPV